VDIDLNRYIGEDGYWNDTMFKAYDEVKEMDCWVAIIYESPLIYVYLCYGILPYDGDYECFAIYDELASI